MLDQSPRSGRCAIIGRTNVGKSTLLNTLLNQKLAIATPKPQTTRSCILGVYLSKRPETQIAFIDTPGFHKPKNALSRRLLEQAKGGLEEADVIVMLTDVGKTLGESEINAYLTGEDGEILQFIGKQTRPVVLAINKVDRLREKSSLLPLMARCQKRFSFAAIVPISALKGDNCDALIQEIRGHLGQGLQFDPETFTDKPERFFAAELIREAAIQKTRDELPYAIAVVIDLYREEPKIVRISATIVVEKENHKGIVIGKKGQLLKSIGTMARREIEALIGRKVFLKLWVKVIKGWTENPNDVRELCQQIEGKDGRL